MNIQWYPGHMTKAKRMMQENIKLIDLVIELVDARAPISSRNPDIDELAKGKARVILLNKADMADPAENEEWKRYFEERGFLAILCNSKQRKGIREVSAAVMEVCQEKFARDRKRGILNRPVRAMVVGIPNVGKSTFINAFAGKACAKTGNRPGVTKGKQWIRLNKQVELLDTPGILWPKFEDQKVGQRLAMIGSIKEELLEQMELAGLLVSELTDLYPGVIEKKYDLPQAKDAEKLPFPYQILHGIAIARNCLVRGSEVDMEKAAHILLDDFQNGRLGQLSLERAKDM